VLPLTVALPDWAFWWFELLTLTFVVLVSLNDELLRLVIWLLECGPVLLMLFEPLPDPDDHPEPLLEFETFTLVDCELLFEALPVEALPPQVLPRTLAFPERADCQFELFTFTLVLLVSLNDERLLLVIWLLECGPVVSMLLDAWAKPTPSVAASTPLESNRMNRFLIHSHLLS